MKTKIVLTVLTLALLLSGCQLLDNIFATGAGTTGPGASWLLLDNGVSDLATEQAGSRQWSVQQGTPHPNNSVLGIIMGDK